MGWGATVLGICLWLYDKAPHECRMAVLIGVLSWFLTDSLGSFLSGNGVNILFNILIAVVAIGPLAWKPKDKE